MAKSKKKQADHYLSIVATVDCDSLSWEWTIMIDGVERTGGMAHDDTVADYSAEDIVQLTVAILGLSKKERSLVKVEYA